MKNLIVINETQTKELRAMATDPLDDKLAKRASIILALSEGKKTRDVAKEVGINKDAVTRWKNRFLEGGISALYSEHGGGVTSKSTIPDIQEKIKSLIETNIDETWTRKKLAEQLGISEIQVNNELSKMHLTLSRNTSWQFPTTDTTQSRCMCIVGLYLSQYASSIIVCTSDNELIPGEEIFITRNRLLADQLKNHPEQITLLDIIWVASDHAKETWKKKTQSMQEFLDELISGLPDDPSLSYFTIGVSKDQFQYHGKKPLNLVYLPANDHDEWIMQVERVFKELSAPTDQPMIKDILEAIKHFQAVCTSTTEPFLWKKTIDISKSEQQSQTLDIQPESKPVESHGYSSVEEALSSILGAPPMEDETVEVAMITIVRDKENITYSVVQSQEAFPQADKFDFSSPEGFMHGFNQMEKPMIHLRNTAGEEASRLFVESVKKKAILRG